MTQRTPTPSPYLPPQSPVADPDSVPIAKPRTVKWAITALWVSYGLTCVHAAIVVGARWLSWPPEIIALAQIVFAGLYWILITLVSEGRFWAQLVYALLLCGRTATVIRYLPSDWQDSHGLELITAVSFLCQYVAMYWLFTKPGRQWASEHAD